MMNKPVENSDLGTCFELFVKVEEIKLYDDFISGVDEYPITVSVVAECRVCDTQYTARCDGDCTNLARLGEYIQSLYSDCVKILEKKIADHVCL